MRLSKAIFIKGFKERKISINIATQNRTDELAIRRKYFFNLLWRSSSFSALSSEIWYKIIDRISRVRIVKSLRNACIKQKQKQERERRGKGGRKEEGRKQRGTPTL
jgi:hypothetical protein